MLDRERFIVECREAIAADPTHKAIRELVARAVSDPGAVMRELGEPGRAGLNPLFRSPELSIFNIVWGPGMSVLPHNHNMWAVIGIYSGREDNIFWRRVKGADGREIEAAGARSLCVRDADALGRDVIHSVLNPIDRLTGAIHVYGGDLIGMERSQWIAETLRERPYDPTDSRRRFEASNAALGPA
jgi:predicted metal-dependent enzyme (double-stranded beta helix superfamily)